MNKSMLTILGIVLLVAAGLIYSKISKVWQEEIAISADWLDLQTEVDELISGARDQLGVIQFTGDVFESIITSAVAAQPGNEETGKNALFVSLQQAYPNVDSLELAKVAQDLNSYIAGKRANINDAQSKIITRVTEYEKYLTTPEGAFLSIFGLPSSHLRATVSRDLEVTGSEALTWIRTPIVGADTHKSFQTGEMQQAIPLTQPTQAR